MKYSNLLSSLVAMTVTFPVGALNAEVIASTTFDGRTLSETNVADDTASDLNWIVNGVEDPGSMVSLNAAGNGLRLFDDQADVRDIFAPGINTGNGNTFWTTEVSLTVLPGMSVTLTDITFDNWSINAGQVQNVNRRNDFTFSVIDPSGVTVTSVDVVDSLSGTTAGIPTVTLIFGDAVPLSEPGTYTIGIKGGDFLGSNETGNHTAIDNLSINGEVGGGADLQITEMVFDPDADTLSLTWNSSPGQSYVVRYSTDLENWNADLDDGIPAAPSGEFTTVEFDLRETGALDLTKAFFRVEVQTDP